jgi:hypothetical protein
MTDEATEQHILELLKDKRHALDRYLEREAPRKRALLNISLLAGGLATLLTAAPAVGGKALIELLKAALGLQSPVWQLMCAGAAVCSALATVANQLLKSNGREEQLLRARTCRARLEALELGLTVGSLDAAHATPEYARCLEDSAQLELA